MPPAPARRTVRRAPPLAIALSLLLLSAACVSGGGGGDGGNGNGGDTEYVLSVLVVNRDESVESHVLSYSGGAPLANSQDGEIVEACRAAVVQYAVTLPFELMIDGVVAINSDEVSQPVPFDSDLLANIEILADGTVATPPFDPPTGPPVTAGRGINKPAAVGICL